VNKTCKTVRKIFCLDQHSLNALKRIQERLGVNSSKALRLSLASFDLTLEARAIYDGQLKAGRPPKVNGMNNCFEETMRRIKAQPKKVGEKEPLVIEKGVHL